MHVPVLVLVLEREREGARVHSQVDRIVYALC